MNATLKTVLGSAAAIAATAGLLGVMGLELQRSFDPSPVERAAVQMPRGNASGGSDAGTRTAEPECC